MDRYKTPEDIKLESGAEFSVYQYFPNGSYERVLNLVDAETAIKKAHHLINSVGGRIGTTVRVLVTDGYDFCNFEWVYGKGIIFPTQEHLQESKEGKEFFKTSDVEGNDNGQT